MTQHNTFLIRGIVSLGLLSTAGFAQVKPAVPDAQVEANVLKALAGSPQLANQSITSTTVYGTVTLSGNVSDDASRELADKLVSNTTGVLKVVDQMVVGGQPAAQQGSNPVLQSDGTYATPDNNANAQVASPPQPQQATQYPAQPQGQYPPAYGQYPPQSQYPPHGQYPPQQAGQYPPPQYGNPNQQGGPYYGPPARPYVPQKGGDAVVVPTGATIQVRINQGMDSRHTVQGSTFNGVVLSNVWQGNSIAIPRGATIQGSVVEVHPAGELKGKGELKLQLNQIAFSGRTYPIATDFWWHQGADKTGATVGNTVGLGAMGALIGAVAGGGVGAAVGAGIGGIAGLGISSASGKGEASIPPEAIVSFHLTQPANLTTASQAELDQLGASLPPSAQPRMVRRYPPPPPPYYGPVYYRPY